MLIFILLGHFFFQGIFLKVKSRNAKMFLLKKILSLATHYSCFSFFNIFGDGIYRFFSLEVNLHFTAVSLSCSSRKSCLSEDIA